MKFKRVLFDVGNVIASDYWESIWLSRHLGLADRLGIPIGKAKSVGRQLWEKHAVIRTIEAEYWEDASSALDVNFGVYLIKNVERLTIRTNPYIIPLFSKLIKEGINIGIISNNTTFWYIKQILKSRIAEFLTEEMVFLSCNYGVEKCGAERDLFSHAADKITPQETLVVDDRMRNVQRAKALGFESVIYPRGTPTRPEEGYYEASPFGPLSLNRYF